MNCVLEQMWVTTRPHRKGELESTLGEVAFSIKELTREQQVWFLSKFWLQATNKNWNHIMQIAERLVENLNKGLIQGKSFLGIPLQTYMFAVVFMDEINKDNPEISNNIELTNLFQRFINTKYDLYFKKFGPSFLPKDIRNVLVKLFDETHQDFALRNINLPSTKEFYLKQVSLEEDRLLQIGIVYKSNEKFHFIHRSFAEYLTAKKLADIALTTDNERDTPLLNKTVESLISNNDSKFLLFLFDSIVVEKYPLHQCVLRGFQFEVEKLSDEEVDAKDCLNRSLFYYAVQYSHFNIMEILIPKKGYLSENDEFLVLAFKAYLKNSYKHDIEGLQSTDQLLSNLFDSSFNFCLTIINSFDLSMEMDRKNWKFVEKVLKAKQVSKIFGYNVFLLENALIYKAPMDVIMVLFESIRMNKDFLLSGRLTYSRFIKYLLICDAELVDKLLCSYKSTFKDRVPLYVNVYEHFDLRFSYLGESISSLISIIERRASHFTFVTKNLLEKGASYPLLDNNVDAFSDKLINIRFTKSPLVQYMEENFQIEKKYLNLTLENFLDQKNLSQSQNEFNKMISNFYNILKLNTQDKVKEIIVNIVVHILKSSDARNLLHLTYNFHQAVEKNDWKVVKQCLKTASKNSWKKALLNSTNRMCRTAIEEAKKKYYLRTYVLLRMHR